MFSTHVEFPGAYAQGASGAPTMGKHGFFAPRVASWRRQVERFRNQKPLPAYTHARTIPGQLATMERCSIELTGEPHIRDNEGLHVIPGETSVQAETVVRRIFCVFAAMTQPYGITASPTEFAASIGMERSMLEEHVFPFSGSASITFAMKIYFWTTADVCLPCRRDTRDAPSRRTDFEYVPHRLTTKPDAHPFPNR